MFLLLSHSFFLIFLSLGAATTKMLQASLWTNPTRNGIAGHSSQGRGRRKPSCSAEELSVHIPLGRWFEVNLGLTQRSSETVNRKPPHHQPQNCFSGKLFSNWVILTNSLVMTNTVLLQMKHSPKAVHPVLPTGPNRRSGPEALSKIKAFCNLMEFN